MRIAGPILVVVALAGCATGYKADGGFGAFSGGFSETQLAPNMWRVSFKGNGYTSPERAQDMTLLRSADVVLQAGYTHFAIVGANTRVDTVNLGNAPTSSTTTGTLTPTYGGAYAVQAQTNSWGGGAWVANKPSSNNTILAFKGQPADAGAVVYDAQFIYNSLGKKLGAVK